MGEREGRAFSAFVSYSHADKKAAQKLHKKLESYRLPKHVAARLADAKNAGDSGASDRLGQIFRDREDLPAAEDLSESVKAALKISQALVVLCSPAAKASPWVAREIELFRELHPDRPVLAALIEGEPDEALPLPLTLGKEPLAADLRKEGDGSRLGFLKVVAGIAAVPLDALVQRDAQRRVRRVMAVTGGALAAMLVMAIMTVVAIESRNEAQAQRAEAQHQQAQADGLIGFMLTDLREDLKGVGRLDIMTAVNKRAMEYYENQGDLSALPVEALEKRAFVLHSWGEDDLVRGDRGKALAKFREAYRVTEELFEREKENPDRIYSHAQSEFWLGYVAFLNGKKESARRHFEVRKSLALSLVELPSRKADWIVELAFAYGDLCAVSLGRPQQPSLALEECKLALETMLSVYRSNSSNPTVIENYANRQAWMADAWLANGKIDLAFEHRIKQQELVNQLIKLEPENMERIENLMRAQLSFAQLLTKTNRVSQLRSFLKAAKGNADRLLQHDPHNQEWRGWSIQIDDLEKKGGL